MDKQYQQLGMQKSDAYIKLEASSKSLTRKVIGLEKFKANIDALRV